MEIRHSDDTGCTISHCYQPGSNFMHGVRITGKLTGKSPVGFFFMNFKFFSSLRIVHKKIFCTFAA